MNIIMNSEGCNCGAGCQCQGKTENSACNCGK